MTTFWLSTHVGYACRHSGACCTARWPIPIERDRAPAVQAAIAAGRVHAPEDWYRAAPEAPADVAGVLARQPSGACVFHRPDGEVSGLPSAGGCAIHPLRPVACRHFPYVCVIDPRGVHVTLSHFCPTAANRLFDVEVDVSIVKGPAVPLEGVEPEGLDAREGLPPAELGAQGPALGAAPGTMPAPGTRPRLLSWDAVSQWERMLVARLGKNSSIPDAPSVGAFDRARAAVLPGWAWPEAPADVVRFWHSLVAPQWGGWTQVIGRYLAAKAHASWAMHLGTGPPAVERMVGVSRIVLQVEATRACLSRGGGLDRPALTEALRQADLLLVHYADPFRFHRDAA